MPVATKKLRSNRAWIERHINDPFVKRSRAEGYRARSVYKLIELDEKEHLLKPGSTVVDLGSAPGSWTQVVREDRGIRNMWSRLNAFSRRWRLRSRKRAVTRPLRCIWSHGV